MSNVIIESGLVKYMLGRTDDDAQLPVPIVFPANVPHAAMAQLLANLKCQVISAGHVKKFGDKWKVVTPAGTEGGGAGKIVGTNPIDQVILDLFLNQGLTGVQLQNAVLLVGRMASGS